MCKKYAFLFPGQGAQVPGMIKDIAEQSHLVRKVLDSASDITGTDLRALLWNTEQAVLNRSDNSQLAITVASIAITTFLSEKGIFPSAAMGFSLGEYPALFVSSVLSFEETIRLVMARGNIMQSVCDEIALSNEGHVPGMCAVLGLLPDEVKRICSSIPDAYAANMNSSKQTVVSGTFEALGLVEDECKKAGARRVVRLAVAGPFHSPLMKKAADEFAGVVEKISFADPRIPLFSNVTGKQVLSGEEAKKNAVLHLTNPVLWTAEENILGATITGDCLHKWFLLETGPGKVLSGLWKDCEYSGDVSCTPVNCVDGINALLSSEQIAG